MITHHAPTPRSIAPRFHGSALNPAFASNLERLIARYQPALWIHGHMHNSVDVTVGETRVLANSAGYNPGKNPDYRVTGEGPRFVSSLRTPGIVSSGGPRRVDRARPAGGDAMDGGAELLRTQGSTIWKPASGPIPIISLRIRASGDGT